MAATVFRPLPTSRPLLCSSTSSVTKPASSAKSTLDQTHSIHGNFTLKAESQDVSMIADRATSFFADAKSEDEPFFLTIGYIDPHHMIGQQGGFGNVPGNHNLRLRDWHFSPEEVHVPSLLTDVPEVRQELSEYYRAIYHMDQGVGMVLDHLKSQQLNQNTLVLFLSDNGPPFINSRTTMYDAGIRFPFLLQIPGQDLGLLNHNMVCYVDILLTFLDWADCSQSPATELPCPAQRYGHSILPISTSLATTDMQDTWSREFSSHMFHKIINYYPMRYMPTARYKYHRNICWKLDFPFAMDLYAGLSFEGIRNNGSAPVAMRTCNGDHKPTTSHSDSNHEWKTLIGQR